jgi:hypothetical protein
MCEAPANAKAIRLLEECIAAVKWKLAAAEAETPDMKGDE